jgi:hypothetical protein
VLGSRVVLTTWFVVSVVGMVAFAAVLLLIVRDEVRLDVHHERARATVVRTFDGGRGPGRALVRFAVAGRPVEAEVGLSWFGDTPRAGAPTAVEYDPGHPTRARRAGSHDVVGIAVPVAAIAVLAVAGWRPWRRRRW